VCSWSWASPGFSPGRGQPAFETILSENLG
jgi:hypothetical protein